MTYLLLFDIFVVLNNKIMKSNLVLTICLGDYYTNLKKLTHPSIERYAKKINADFQVLTERNFENPKWEKTQIFNLLNKYLYEFIATNM